uniref:Glycosyltransferase n=1 Tax=Linum usitatissimum TaxID=4006 RepID=I2BH36_LINUS|nr:UDP-glycosyltransferase 1 [Linum usitatissimum]
MAPGRVMDTPTQLPCPPPPPPPPHFILFPLMTQGHTIPIIDMARLLTDRGCLVTIVTTPLNSTRFEPTIHRANNHKHNPNLHPIRLIKLTFPCEQVGLPQGYENLDVLPSPVFLKRFYDALELLEEPLESELQRLVQAPSCLISDRCLSWTARLAERLGIPRIVFHGMSCFSLLSALNIRKTNAHLSSADEYEPFLVPGMPKCFHVHVSRVQLPGSFVRLPDLDDVRNKMQEAETTSFGVVANTSEELEDGCAQEYQNAIGKKVWCIGPVSLRNTHNLDKFDRGNKPSIDQSLVLEWLGQRECGSVIYACLGSLCRLIPAQLIELGLGLEASGKPFIWVVKTDQRPTELEDWLVRSGFEERVKGRGLLIKGWAPQVLILSHASVGGFLTHCGWNSTAEAISCGVPMVTWPLFAEQFLNEKLVVEILSIGVRIGVESPVRWGNEETVGVMVTREAVEKAVTAIMNNSGEEGKKRKNRIKKLAEMTNKSMGDTGSSHLNLTELIADVVKQQGATQHALAKHVPSNRYDELRS